MPNFEEICLIMVTYFPREKTLSNIAHLSATWTELELVVVDNSPCPHPPDTKVFFAELLQTYPRVHVIRNNANAGIAAALNQGARYAIDRGYRWMVTLDQDTRLDPNYFLEIDKVLEFFPKGKPIAVIGVNYINTTSEKMGETVSDDRLFVETLAVITSGCFTSLEAYRMIGGFMERLFIDMVDTEYCFRARRNGFAVVFANKPLMIHSIGVQEKIRWFGHEIKFSSHAAYRNYYIFRNTLYMLKQYFCSDFFWSLTMVCKYLPKVFLKAMWTGAHRASLYNIACGIRDGVVSDFSNNPGKEGANR